MRSVRTVVRTLIAGFLAVAGPVLAAPAALAHAQDVQQSYRTAGASSHQLTVSIDAINHSFATPASTITVSGTVTNHTGSPLSGVQVQLLTSAQYFYTREDMDSYAAGGTLGYIFPQPVSAPDVLTGTLHRGATMRWSASFTAAQAGYGAFGVFPLVAQAEYPDGVASGAGRTFLPYWPGNGYADPLNTAWVWPLIDQPQQGPCPQTLATNELAASLGTGGRLGTLLAIGQLWGQEDHLTWAVDPALLSDAQVMTRPYEVGFNSLCKGGKPERASSTAALWLSSLRAGTAGQPMFVTPYADPDAAALTHAGLAASLRAAYQLGDSVARKILPRPFGMTNADSPGGGGSPAVAWPAGGVADASTITSLAASGISAVLLNSNEMRSTTAPYDNATAATTTAAGKPVSVLLADAGLTRVLGSAPASSPAGAQFAAEQDFIAETAMIAAEAPFKRRSLVIAPPRRWDPSASEAAGLLSMTHSAPWLRDVGLARLATAAGSVKARQKLPAYQVGSTELSASFLDQVALVNSNVATFEDLLYRPGSGVLRQLDMAAAVMESSAWRADAAASGRLALTKLSDYLTYWEGKVQILTGTKLLLAGASGPAPVSVRNAGLLPVQVRVTVAVPANSKFSVGNIGTAGIIDPGKTWTLRMTVRSGAIGTTQLQLQLVTRNGTPLPWTSKPLSVEATQYGRALFVLIGAALGVLVLTAVARWIRRLNGTRAHGRPGGTG